MSRSALIGLVVAAVAMGSAACSSTPAPVEQSHAGVELDSIVMERGPCFGFCPRYRVVLEGSGRIRYRNAGERQLHADSVAPEAVAAIVSRAAEIGFDALPDRIMDDKTLCSMVATDHPGVIVSIFRGTSAKTVDHYTGCHVQGPESPGIAPAIVRLIALENLIDSTANVERWQRQPGAR